MVIDGRGTLGVMTEQLEPMPADWQRALAITAHPDDVEFGAAGAVAVWTRAGRDVAYVMVSRGEAGIDGLDPMQCAEVREREQRESAAVVGVQAVEFLNHRDGVIEYGPPLRRDLAAAIRRHRPELVITGSHEERPPWGGWNSADHRAVGLAVLDAVHDAGNRWIFPQLVEDGLQPWRGVRWVAVAGSSRPTHAVDVSAVLDVAVASLAAHQVYLEGLGADHGMPDPKTFVEIVTGAGAPRFGGLPALTFELIPFA